MSGQSEHVPAAVCIRAAALSDLPALQALIAASVRGLSAGFYTELQIETALRHVFGVDTQIIGDATYYVIDTPDTLAAAGGWSARRTLFGGDHMRHADEMLLDPGQDPARIRAFFVHPDWARRGLARKLYNHCAAAARAAGFQRLELMATMPGVPLYMSLGFTAVEHVTLPLPNNVTLPLVRMERTID